MFSFPHEGEIALHTSSGEVTYSIHHFDPYIGKCIVPFGEYKITVYWGAGSFTANAGTNGPWLTTEDVEIWISYNEKSVLFNEQDFLGYVTADRLLEIIHILCDLPFSAENVRITLPENWNE